MQSCDCGADVQTMEHVINECTVHCFQEDCARLHVTEREGSNGCGAGWMYLSNGRLLN